MPTKRVRVAAVAAALVASPLAFASPAFAAGGPHQPPSSPGLTGAQRGADAVLTQYTRRLGMIEARESSSTVINSTDLSSLEAATAAESTAIANDKTAVNNATSVAEVRALVASGRTTLSEAVLDWQVVVAADRIEARDATLTTATATATATATEAADSTKAAEAAVTVVTSLSASPKPVDVRTARVSATGDLRLARRDLAAALHDASLAAHLPAKI